MLASGSPPVDQQRARQHLQAAAHQSMEHLIACHPRAGGAQDC